MKFFPFVIFAVQGESMFPNFIPGDRVVILTWGFSLQTGDAVVLFDPRNGRKILKRISKVKKEGSGLSYYVLGDNVKESTDSRVWGWVSQEKIIGKVIWKV